MGVHHDADWPRLEHRIDLAITRSLRRVGLKSGDVIVVGVSGGPDSMALLTALGVRAGRIGIKLHVAHLVHDPPGTESRGDADYVRRIAEAGNKRFTIAEADVPAYQRERGISSFEQAARDLRYAFLARVASEAGAATVAVGHTADDQAETTLFHVARGAGLHGLRGMREISPWPLPEGRNLLRLWRPLLDFRRAETVAYCRGFGIDFRDDPTNYSPKFARNRIRHNLMPALQEQLNPQVVHALTRLSRTAALQLEYLEERASQRWPAVAPEPITGDGSLRLDRNALAGVHPALQLLLLRRAWIQVTGDEKRLRESHLQLMTTMVAGKKSGKMAMLPGGYVARTRGRWLELAPDNAVDDCPYPALSREFRITLPWGPIAVGVTKQDGWEVAAQAVRLTPDASPDTGDPMAAYLAPAALAEGANVRTWRPGDRIRPLGMSGTRKLQDVFTDAGVPRNWRDRIPLVVTPRGVAWAVGVRLADWAGLPPSDGDERPAILVKFERAGSQ